MDDLFSSTETILSVKRADRGFGAELMLYFYNAWRKFWLYVVVLQHWL